MSYLDGTNYQAQKEDEGQPLFSNTTQQTVERVKHMNKVEIIYRLGGKSSYEDKMEIFKEDFESYRAKKITWGKLQETVSGLLQL